MQTLILAITAVMPTLLGGGAALAVPGPSVRAEATPIEGRLVFEWDAPTAVQTLRAGQRLTLRFTRLPPADDLFVAMARLAPWLSNLTPAARPGEVGLELRDGVSADVRQGAAAERTVVVLRHRSATSRMPTGAAVPIHGPEMDVRSGTHPGFGRLVLDGGAPLGSEVHREGDELVVATRVALPERARTQALALPRWISGATLGGRTLRLRLEPGVVVREERPNAAKLVLDFSVLPRAPPSRRSRLLCQQRRSAPP
jgi:hypothetical protein